jgi:hypothetical protein
MSWQQFRASRRHRWADASVADLADQIFTRAMLGTDYADAARTGRGPGRLPIVEQTARAAAGGAPASSVAVNPHRGATAFRLIVLPPSVP